MGTEVDSSLFRTSRTCLELTAKGNSTGVSTREKAESSGNTSLFQTRRL